jgi:hypothetical protein
MVRFLPGITCSLSLIAVNYIFAQMDEREIPCLLAPKGMIQWEKHLSGAKQGKPMSDL